MPGCLADGRVLIFPSTGWDWRNLTHASPANGFTMTRFKAAILVEVDEPDSVAVVAFS